MSKNYKNITIEDIEKAVDEIYTKNKDFDFGLRTPEQVAQLRKMLGNFAFDSLGDKIYKLPGGGYTGQGGWDLLIKAFKKYGKK